METQDWPHDAQPSFENGGVARKLSFEAACENPSPPGHPKDTAVLEEATTPSMPVLGPGPCTTGTSRGSKRL